MACNWRCAQATGRAGIAFGVGPPKVIAQVASRWPSGLAYGTLASACSTDLRVMPCLVDIFWSYL
eukprot:6490663-Pyramimonas_sp.AAC.1